MSSEKFAARLARLMPSGMSERAFAREIGISIGGLRGLLHEGNSPNLDTLMAIARARGVSVSWLATGEGSQFSENMPISAVSTISPGFSEEQAPYSASPDPELFGRIVDRIARVYREENVRLSDIDLGRLAAEKYAEIASLAADPDEWPGFLDIVAGRVRKTIRAAALDPANVKREA